MPRANRSRCKQRLKGGLAAGMCPGDFDPKQLAIGTKVELEHTGDRGVAREIAMDHLAEFPDYYVELAKMEHKLEKAKPNRRRVYDAEDMAANIRETFQATPSKWRYDYDFNWPDELQFVGESLAVAYSSDKWQEKKGDNILYKHLAESRNRALCLPGLIRDYDRPTKPWPVVGPMVLLRDVPMPRHFAILGLFEEADLRLHTGGSQSQPKFAKGKDTGVVKLTVRHGMLGASKFLWSRRKGRRKDQPFLVVFTEEDGVLMVIVGDKLDVEKEGIVG